MNSRSKYINRQNGMTIVEIMIALLLSMVLSAGVVQIYLSNKQTYYLQDEMSRLQENGRFAISVLQKSIRGAGIAGGQVFDSANTADASTTPPAHSSGNSAIYNSPNDQIEVVRNAWTDCTGFQVSNPKNVPPDTPVQITEFFYIEQGVNGIRNLACFSGGRVAQLVENVETMEIVYGLDSDGDRSADRYIGAAQVTALDAWSQVVSVRIAMLLATSTDPSRSQIAPQPMVFPAVATYPLLSSFGTNDGYPSLFDSDGDGLSDTNIAQDNRLYRVFTTTIAVRNRVL